MTDAPITEKEIRETENYLKSYQLSLRLTRMDRYEREYLGYRDGADDRFGDCAVARAKMYEIRHFIMDIENCDEKLLLYYHYVRGETVEKCGELLGISRAGAFRLRKRALCLATQFRLR